MTLGRKNGGRKKRQKQKCTSQKPITITLRQPKGLPAAARAGWDLEEEGCSTREGDQTSFARLLLVPKENRRDQGEHGSATQARGQEQGSGRSPSPGAPRHPPRAPPRGTPRRPPRALPEGIHSHRPPQKLFPAGPARCIGLSRRLGATGESQTLAGPQPRSPLQRSTKPWENWAKSSTELGLVPTHQPGEYTSQRKKREFITIPRIRNRVELLSIPTKENASPRTSGGDYS